jgi:nucleotide-binding universal stress UspA family protein
MYQGGNFSEAQIELFIGEVGMSPSSLMVHVTAGANNDAVLKFTAALAASLRVKRVVGIAACQPLQVMGDAAGYVPMDIFEQDRVDIENQLAEAESRFREMLSAPSLAVEWRSTVTFNLLAGYIAEQSRAADIIVTNPPAAGSLLDTTRRVGIADLALRTGRPVMVVDPAVEKPDLTNVLVAWKDSREARRAAEDALPLLRIAGKVTVVEVARESELAEAQARIEDVAQWLKGHGIAALAQAACAATDDASQLDTIARTVDAGLIVGGAYGHNRLREWVLGGVTRDLLLAPPRCSFVSH